MKKLAIITTHPIQYYAPIFRLLAQRLELIVFYTGGEQLVNQFDKGFKKRIEWDLPLLDGYDYIFLKNTSKKPGSYHFGGIKNPSAIKQISNFAPNAILIYGWSYQSHLKILHHFKKKVQIYFRGDSTLLDDKNGLKSIFKKIFLKWVYHHIDFAFFVGSANKAYFKRYGLKESQLIFAPHAIDNERFGKDKVSEAGLLREKLGIRKESILILFAGKFEAKKNPELLLKVFMDLALPNLHLLFVGNGELESKLKAESKTHKDKSYCIHFMHFQNQSQMPTVYQACDLFCLPSRGPRETWGLAVNEAMAASKAILVSDKVGCYSDLVKSRINGEIFKSDDTQDLKNKLKGLALNRNMLTQFGKSSQFIIQGWSFEKQVNSFIESFNS